MITEPVFRQIEADLRVLRYRGVPIGSALSDTLVIDLFWGHGDWRRRERWLSQAIWLRESVRPRRSSGGDPAHTRGRILVTWAVSTPRLDDMLLPVVEELGHDRCEVMLGSGDAIPGLPSDFQCIGSKDALTFSPRAWRAEYRRCRATWRRVLRDVCQRYRLPYGAFQLLFMRLLVASQRIEGFLRYLEDGRPSLVLTENDRSALWSCLILAANRLRIPTITLVHGVIRPDALASAPILANLVVCWGDLDRQKFINAGESPERVLIGGCPRLTRDLPVDREEARQLLALDPEERIALLATSPDRGYVELAELFCTTIDKTADVRGVVRLHPAESISVYADVARRHPTVRFIENREATLNESLAAADVVVVKGSGVGSDALVKRRPVVVLSPTRELQGHDWDLVHLAGCPVARTPEELAVILNRLLGDEGASPGMTESSERYVAAYCSAFGRDSARLISQTARRLAAESIADEDK